MPTPILTALLIVANVLGAGMIVPQVARTHRRGEIAGVSIAWLGVGVALNAWWVGYALAGHLYGILPVSIGALVLYGILAVLHHRIVGRGTVAGLARGAVAVSLAPGVALALAGWTAAGLMIGLSYAVQFSPAMITAVRSADLSGISPTTWSMAFGEAAIWLVYGLAIADAALVIGGGGGAAMSAVILVRLAGRSGRLDLLRPAPQVAQRLD
ncbi:MAG: hypothetical protein AAF548_15625 [Actinomycetota bacterium]